jgi:hypothetical protein
VTLPYIFSDLNHFESTETRNINLYTMGFLKKFKTEMKSAFGDDKPSYPGAQQQQSQMPMTDQPASLQEPSPLDVLRYRYQHGTNFGSIFVLEKWLTGSMYPENADSAELAAVTGNIKAMGLDAARQKFENHWETYISDSDLDWLANQAHCMFLLCGLYS